MCPSIVAIVFVVNPVPVTITTNGPVPTARSPATKESGETSFMVGVDNVSASPGSAETTAPSIASARANIKVRIEAFYPKPTQGHLVNGPHSSYVAEVRATTANSEPATPSLIRPRTLMGAYVFLQKMQLTTGNPSRIYKRECNLTGYDEGTTDAVYNSRSIISSAASKPSAA
jgi:predicted secreted protein